MNDRALSIEDEIGSIGRRADQACTAHAFLRDRYQLRALILDYALMAASTYLFALSFIEPVTGLSLSFGADTKLVIALASIATFFLSIVQFKSDWKSKAQAHADALREHAAIKSDCRAVTKGTRSASATELQRIRSRYDLLGETGTHIPENQFLSGKAKHARKVFLSQYLDSNPGAWPWLVVVKLFMRDNVGLNLLKDHGPSNQKNQSG
jgi:hypothetical protein